MFKLVFALAVVGLAAAKPQWPLGYSSYAAPAPVAYSAAYTAPAYAAPAYAAPAYTPAVAQVASVAAVPVARATFTAPVATAVATPIATPVATAVATPVATPVAAPVARAAFAAPVAAAVATPVAAAPVATYPAYSTYSGVAYDGFPYFGKRK